MRLNKQIFCTIDQWIELNVEDIRKLEEEVKYVLEEKVKSASGNKNPPYLTPAEKITYEEF